MSRCGYTEDYGGDNWAMIKWRGQVASAIRGKRGQAFLMELLDALEAMPEKRLIADDLHVAVPVDGPFPRPSGVCALGSVGLRRGLDMSDLDPEDYETIAASFGISRQLVQEIEYENDIGTNYNASPEDRWEHVHDWAMRQLRPVPVTDAT